MPLRLHHAPSGHTEHAPLELGAYHTAAADMLPLLLLCRAADAQEGIGTRTHRMLKSASFCFGPVAIGVRLDQARRVAEPLEVRKRCTSLPSR